MNLHELVAPHWIQVGAVAPDSLESARGHAHHASQLVAACGGSLLPKSADDSQFSMQWLSRVNALVGEELPGGLHAGLRLHDLNLLLLNNDGSESLSLPLGGSDHAKPLKWLQQAWAESTGAEVPKLALPKWEMPEVKEKFSVDGSALAELARWYANADRVLQFISARNKAASRVRCWPHHFDMDTVFHLGRQRSIGVGMSPGDISYHQPYFYVTPHPTPKGTLPAPKGGGVWHRKGWTGAVLTASKVAAARDSTDQARAVCEFLESAISACRAVLAE